MSDDTRAQLDRRYYLKLAGTAGALGLAGCAGNGGQGETTTTTTQEQGDGTTTTQEPSFNTLEIVHWWTAGGEKQALQALIDGFTSKYPEISIENNPAPGGAGSALDTVIKSRVLNENPPSTFQIWPGKSLHPYVEAGILKDIGDSVWSQKMRDAYQPGVMNMARPQGNLVAVPLNIHRLNNLFYNVSVVESAGVDPTTIQSPGDLLSALRTIGEQTDAAPMAQQTKSVWSTVQLWEDVLLGQSGVDTYTSILDGNVAENESAVKDALTTVKKYSNYFNKDSGSISWDQANAKVINGDAAVIHQGDWAAGQYKAREGFTFGEDWDYVPFPGTDSVYHVVTDSFVFPQPNPSPEATERWLQYCGSVEGQKKFNPIKGSIPPRTDVPKDPFGPFLREQMDDFAASSAQPPTIAHGTGVVPEVKSSIEGALSSFISNWDVNQAYQGIKNAF
ncbi:MAG: ABC transporter substrate-binding protein [Halodesulfurarchaeum sp.]